MYFKRENLKPPGMKAQTEILARLKFHSFIHFPRKSVNTIEFQFDLGSLSFISFIYFNLHTSSSVVMV